MAEDRSRDEIVCCGWARGAWKAIGLNSRACRDGRVVLYIYWGLEKEGGAAGRGG